ncbi:MAG: uroporphyrinogen decarboxylase family protein [Verrucomicrobiota bacterium]
MSPRERILATLDRRPVDRVPVDLWLTPEVLDSLRSHTGVEDEYQLYQTLGVDKIAWVFPGYRAEKFDPNEGEGLDPWGVPLHKVKSGMATYMEYGKPPLGEMDDPSQLDDHPLWPLVGEFNYAAAKATAERARSFGFATIGPWISHYEIYCHMRGMENALMDIIAEPEFLNAALDRIDSIQAAMLDRFLRELGDLIDIVFISDDMGTQESQLISIPAWSEHLKPRLAHWCDLIHSHGKKVLFHTDGACREFVPHLIECGVDILNPIQHVCPGMDRAGLNRDFGKDVIFHGGVENQHILPHGSTDDVRREVITCLETLGAGGGYIPCSCHNIQAGTPPENVLTLIETVREWKMPG